MNVPIHSFQPILVKPGLIAVCRLQIRVVGKAQIGFGSIAPGRAVVEAEVLDVQSAFCIQEFVVIID